MHQPMALSKARVRAEWSMQLLMQRALPRWRAAERSSKIKSSEHTKNTTLPDGRCVHPNRSYHRALHSDGKMRSSWMSREASAKALTPSLSLNVMWSVTFTFAL